MAGKSQHAEEARQILKLQFENAAEFAESTQDSSRAAVFTQLADTTKDISLDLLNAYSELFENGMQESELERQMLSRVGLSWRPDTAAAFIKKFIAARTGNP